jgi:hypothetical protein
MSIPARSIARTNLAPLLVAHKLNEIICVFQFHTSASLFLEIFHIVCHFPNRTITPRRFHLHIQLWNKLHAPEERKSNKTSYHSLGALVLPVAC